MSKEPLFTLDDISDIVKMSQNLPPIALAAEIKKLEKKVELLSSSTEVQEEKPTEVQEEKPVKKKAAKRKRAAKKTEEVKTEEVKTEEVKTEEVKTEEVETSESTKPTISAKTLHEKFRVIVENDPESRSRLVTLLAKYDAKRISDVPKEHYEELVKALDSGDY